MNVFSLDGRVALVTGGSRGIGRSVAHGLARSGASVALVARRREPLEQVAEEIAAEGGRALPLVADIAEEDAAKAAAAATLSKFGRIDILVNNAGSAMNPGRSSELPLSKWDETLRVNLTGAFLFSQAVADAMTVAGGGSIVMVSSSSALCGFPQTAAYSAAKAGMLGLTRALAAEWAPLGIRVNCVCVGPFATDRTARTLAAPDEGIAAYMRDRTPQHRYASPDEAVSSVLYLTAPSSSFVTGSIITVDGGFSAV